MTRVISQTVWGTCPSVGWRTIYPPVRAGIIAYHAYMAYARYGTYASVDELMVYDIEEEKHYGLYLDDSDRLGHYSGPPVIHRSKMYSPSLIRGRVSMTMWGLPTGLDPMPIWWMSIYQDQPEVI